MLLVWFFMGLLDVLITEVWRKTAWSGLQMATAVQYSKHTETPAPTPENQPPPPDGLHVAKPLGARCRGWVGGSGEGGLPLTKV